MKPLAPYRGTLFRLALTNALLVGLVGVAFFQVEDMRAQRALRSQGRTPVGMGTSPSVPRASANEAATAADEEFLRAATDLVAQEVQMAEASARRATRPEVREFARELAARQQVARRELESLAARKGVLLPTGEPRSPDAEQLLLRRDRFDDEFVEWAKARHGRAVQLFEHAADNCADPELRRFAAQMLPALQAQHEHARRLRRAVF